MQAVRKRRTRLASVLFLLALFCHPLLLSGHHHHSGGWRASPTDCSICAVTAHAPALSPPAIPTLALALVGAAPLPRAALPPLRPVLRAQGARAPPSASSTRTA